MVGGAGLEAASFNILVCTPRAGHSWLTSLLVRHPQLTVFTHDAGDNLFLYSLYPLKTVNPYADDGTALDSRTEGLLWGLRIRLVRRYYSRGAEQSKPVVLSTSTAVAFLPLILSAFPHAKVIHLTRDPIDVIASFRRFMDVRARFTPAAWYREFRRLGRVSAALHAFTHTMHIWRWLRCPIPGYLAVRPAGFQRASHLPLLDFLVWYHQRCEQIISNVTSALPSSQKHAVTYEGLVNSYRDEMGGLLEFLGVATTDEFLESTSQTVRTTSLGRNQQELSVEERTWLTEALRVPHSPS